jgi:glucose-6-phosphate isomerase
MQDSGKFSLPNNFGGRYSALIALVLVPFIHMGLDAEKLLKKTEWISRQCQPEIPFHRNPLYY